MVTFEQASYLTKVKRLRALALEAVNNYPIKVKKLEFIKLSANAIFRVTDTKNNQYQLRIHPEVYHSKPAILEEMKWLHHIIKSSNIIVPKPPSTRDGQLIVECHHPAISASRYCNMFTWLPGKRRLKSIDIHYAYHLGVLIGGLQKNGQGMTIKHRCYWNVEGMVGTTKATFWNVENLTDISAADQRIITKARRIVYEPLKHYEDTHTNKSGLIHSDLQPNNILIHHNEYAVIDFDDCGVGLYGNDLAVALFAFEYVTEGDKRKRLFDLKDALYKGYLEHMSLTQEDINLSPYFLLARKLVAIAWLEARRDNPSLRPYFHKSVKRAIEYFATMHL